MFQANLTLLSEHVDVNNGCCDSLDVLVTKNIFFCELHTTAYCNSGLTESDKYKNPLAPHQQEPYRCCILHFLIVETNFYKLLRSRQS